MVHDQVVLGKMYILFSYMRLYIGLDLDSVILILMISLPAFTVKCCNFQIVPDCSTGSTAFLYPTSST